MKFNKSGVRIDKLTTSLVDETEALKEVYDAINRNDIPAAVKAFDPQIEWTEPEMVSGTQTFHGRKAVQAHITKQRGNWVEGTCKPEQFISAGDKIVVFANVRVRLKHDTEWTEGLIGDVYTFRNGKVIQARIFSDRRQALEWAGVKDSHQL